MKKYHIKCKEDNHECFIEADSVAEAAYKYNTKHYREFYPPKAKKEPRKTTIKYTLYEIQPIKVTDKLDFTDPKIIKEITLYEDVVLDSGDNITQFINGKSNPRINNIDNKVTAFKKMCEDNGTCFDLDIDIVRGIS